MGYTLAEQELPDQLDAGQLEAVGRLLEVKVDPVAGALAAAPADAAPVTDDDRRRFHDARESRKQEFLQTLRANPGNKDPQQQDRMVDEFRKLTLGG